MKALLIGFGDLGQRLAPRLGDAGWRVTGLRRSSVAFPGVDTLAGDCRDPVLLGEALAGVDLVVVTTTPDEFTEAGYRNAYLEPARALSRAITAARDRPRLVLWVSSTGVYGQGDGQWVDEMAETRPARFSGQILLEAEEIVAALPVPSTVVRFSGIYGPGRTATLNTILAGHCAPASPVKWSNRIHLEPCYLATDCEPAPLHDVHLWLARQLGVEVTEQSGGRAARGNRRCSNARLLDSGYRFLYPTFREGYGALIVARKKQGGDAT